MKQEERNLKYYLYSGIMLAFGIGAAVSTAIKILLLDASRWFILGYFASGFFIGIGLMPFKIKFKTPAVKKS